MSALHASPGTLQVNNGMLCYRGICSRPVSVCLSVRPSQADIVMKRLDESSWFLAHRLPIYPTVCCCIIRKSGYLQKLGYFPQRLCATFRTLKISPRQVDRVVNSNGRRRRRSHTHTHTHTHARARTSLSVWSEVQTCIWPSRCHCTHCLLLQKNPDWFYLSGTGSPGKSWTKGR